MEICESQPPGNLRACPGIALSMQLMINYLAHRREPVVTIVRPFSGIMTIFISFCEGETSAIRKNGLINGLYLTVFLYIFLIT